MFFAGFPNPLTTVGCGRGFLEVSGGLLAQASAPERPEKATDASGDCRFSRVSVAFLVFFAFVSLSGWFFRWCPESAYPDARPVDAKRGRSGRALAERKPLTGRDRETKKEKKNLRGV